MTAAQVTAAITMTQKVVWFMKLELSGSSVVGGSCVAPSVNTGK